MKLRYYLFPLLATLVLTGAGCVTVNSSGSGATGADGGLWRSGNRGDAWAQKAALPRTDGTKANNGNINVTTVVQDPSDPKALYVGTTDNGLFYSYDGGESWLQPVLLTKGRIPALAVDPKNRCRVYVAIENKLVKTEDCSRTWATTYLDARPDKATAAVLVDFYNPSVLWVANDAGDVLRSTDGGASWSSVKQFGSPVVKFIMSPTDSRRLYVATKNAGVWRTDDGGANFIDLSENYKDIENSRDLYDMAIGISDPNTLILAVKEGLLRSKNMGEKWEDMSLLTPAATTAILSVAIDPKDVNFLYYGTSTTFYKTVNGGVNWIPKKLPTTRAATSLLVDSADSSVLYLGTTLLKQ
jgi:photosystem II stability/assembly factor-like uncharacterized protein